MYFIGKFCIQGVLYGSVGFGCGLIGQGIANLIMTAKRYSFYLHDFSRSISLLFLNEWALWCYEYILESFFLYIMYPWVWLLNHLRMPYQAIWLVLFFYWSLIYIHKDVTLSISRCLGCLKIVSCTLQLVWQMGH